MEDQLLAERALAETLQSYVSQGIPGDVSLLPRVRARVEASQKHNGRQISALRAPRMTTPRTIAILAAAVVFVSAGVVAVATGSLTAPIRIHFTPFPRATPSATPGPCFNGAPTTLSEAQKTVQYHLFTLDGYEPASSLESPTGVRFAPGCGQLSQSKTYGVGITYVIDGIPIQLNEGLASDPRSLTINLKWYATKVAPQIMNIDGSQYAVWKVHPTSNGGCADSVALAAWQIGGTVIYLAPNYTAGNQISGRCSQGAIPFQTFLKIIHNVQ